MQILREPKELERLLADKGKRDGNPFNLDSAYLDN